jgi:hypothetical protein
MRKFRPVVLALLCAVSASAAATVTVARFPPNPNVLPGGGWEFSRNTTFGDPPGPRQWTNGVYGGIPGAKVGTPVNIAGPAGNLPAVVNRAVPWSAIGGAVARCAMNPVCMLAAGVSQAVIKDLLDDYRADQHPSTGDWQYDPGTPEVTEPGFQWQVTGGHASYHPSATAACQNMVQYFTSPNTPLYSSITTSGGTWGYGQCHLKRVSNDTISHTWALWKQAGNITQCPASVDPGNPAWSIPAGSPKGFDGKCPTARYNRQPLNPADLGTKMQANPPGTASAGTDPARGIAAGEEALKGGEEMQGQPESITGPGSQAGTPTVTTTTGPGGTTTTTTTPTYNYTYNTTNITYNITTTTTTNDGTTTTTTNTTAAPEIEVCGLPNTPACKIDETGTVDGGTKNVEAEVEAKVQEAKTAIQDPAAKFGNFPSISWTFALPTGCGIIPTPAFAPFLNGIDVCQFQTTFHDLMGMVWVLGGLFGAIGLFWREQLAGY